MLALSRAVDSTQPPASLDAPACPRLPTAAMPHPLSRCALEFVTMILGTTGGSGSGGKPTTGRPRGVGGRVAIRRQPLRSQAQARASILLHSTPRFATVVAASPASFFFSPSLSTPVLPFKSEAEQPGPGSQQMDGERRRSPSDVSPIKHRTHTSTTTRFQAWGPESSTPPPSPHHPLY